MCEERPRRRRRAVGPPGAVRAGAPPLLDEPERAAPGEDEQAEDAQAEDARLRADRPPHHDRGV